MAQRAFCSERCCTTFTLPQTVSRPAVPATQFPLCALSVICGCDAHVIVSNGIVAISPLRLQWNRRTPMQVEVTMFMTVERKIFCHQVHLLWCEPGHQRFGHERGLAVGNQFCN